MRSEDTSSENNLSIVEWSEKALDGLQAIYLYIHLQSPQNAEYVVNTLIDLGESLKDFPLKFPKEPTLNQENIRFTTKWQYKLIYQIESSRIIILRIFHTKQDPEKLNFKLV